MRATLIANPNAHNVSAASRLVVERALEATFELESVVTTKRGDAERLAREASDSGAKTVIVYGGDGTVNEAVIGLLDGQRATDTILGILPGGGTNVLARNLGSPRDLIESTGHLLSLVASGTHHRIGLGHLRATTADGGQIVRPFTFGAGLVLDAEMVRRVDESGWRAHLGDAAFVLHGLRAFHDLKKSDGPLLTIQTPDGPRQAWWALIGKTDPYTYLGATPFRPTPGAESNHGVYIAAGMTAKYMRTLRWIHQALTSSKHVNHPDLLFLSDLHDLTITGSEPVTLQADGEHLGQVTSVEVDSLPEALPVWA